MFSNAIPDFGSFFLKELSLSWRWFQDRDNSPSYLFYEWFAGPIDCMARAQEFFFSCFAPFVEVYFSVVYRLSIPIVLSYLYISLCLH